MLRLTPTRLPPLPVPAADVVPRLPTLLPGQLQIMDFHDPIPQGSIVLKKVLYLLLQFIVKDIDE